MKTFVVEIGRPGLPAEFVTVKRPADVFAVWDLLSEWFKSAATSLHCQGANITLHHDDCDHPHRRSP